ncbi:nicotinate-nucleotide--dimethylbenzimidazole phosphoribosyltransferase [Halocynthiibacter sp.]|uniref:nicotinate-nucleotide--dimethylbenzimidazole phosphoribosyltransferase n=1 Tax=Halocynthiibacter sp. TaxID=1979210 RepID=UPI003C4EC76C
MLEVSAEFATEIQTAIDMKTKPPGSLGRIEELAAQIAALKGTLAPKLDTCHHVIFAADHGIANEGVSAFPQAVTQQMVLNFLGNGAAANVFANRLDVPVTVVDAGVAGDPIDAPDLVSRRMGAGTDSYLSGPAMAADTMVKTMRAGADIAAECGADAMSFGEMGIGNTATATMLIHKLTGLDLATLTGRGTGLDDDGVARKLAILEKAAARTSNLTTDEVLAQYGGFEILMMAGAMIKAAEMRKVVLVDGFIATSAALVALTNAPHIRPAMVFAHLSEEAGHIATLTHLDAKPVLNLGLRLGEGTGALLVWPLVRAAADMLNNMATFADAGISGKDA